MRAYLLNPPADRPMLREGRCQNPADMRRTHIPQHTLAYIATQAISKGAEVRLRDAMAEDLALADVLSDIRRWSPQLLFANISTPTIKTDIQILDAIKDAFPGLTIAVFGPHATATHEALILNRCMDVVIRGEPEMTAGELVDRIGTRRGLRGTAGITHRDGDAIIVEPERGNVRDLDQLGRPARDLLPNERYVHPVSGKPYAMVSVSRGCSFKCTFCVAPVYYGSEVRKRSVEDILDEIQHDIVGRQGIDHLWFFADDLLADKEYLRRICQGLLDRGVKIRWWGNTRADAKDSGLFELMARSGCFMLSVGGESGDDAVLRGARKAMRVQDIAITVEMLREAGITSLVYFLLGLPGETRESLRRTVEFAKKADPDFAEFYPAIPFPGTELERVARKRGLILDSDPSRHECGGTKLVLEMEGLPERELQTEVLRAYRSFYFRPASFFRVFRSIRSPREMFSLCFFGFNYIRRFANVPALRAQ